MRRLTMLLLSGVIAYAGCTAKFANEADELAYLKSVREPSGAQFQRKLELQRKYIAQEVKKAKAFEAEEPYSSKLMAFSSYEKILDWIGDDPALKLERDEIKTQLEIAQMMNPPSRPVKVPFDELKTPEEKK